MNSNAIIVLFYERW